MPAAFWVCKLNEISACATPRRGDIALPGTQRLQPITSFPQLAQQVTASLLANEALLGR